MAWESLSTVTCCKSLVIIYGGRCVLQVGVAAVSYLSRHVPQKEMVIGDATIIQEYLRNEALRNPLFYYDIQVDSEENITSIFWSDAIMQQDYELFGDLISFDTTYRPHPIRSKKRLKSDYELARERQRFIAQRKKQKKEDDAAAKLALTMNNVD